MATKHATPPRPVTQREVDQVLAALRSNSQLVSHEIVARMWTEIMQRRGN